MGISSVWAGYTGVRPVAVCVCVCVCVHAHRYMCAGSTVGSQKVKD